MTQDRIIKWIDKDIMNSYYWTGLVMNNQSSMVCLTEEDAGRLNKLIEDFLKDPRTKYRSNK